jgi:hypothetical protein
VDRQAEKEVRSIPLVELKGMVDEIAGYAVTITGRLRDPLMAASKGRTHL